MRSMGASAGSSAARIITVPLAYVAAVGERIFSVAAVAVGACV